MYRIINIQILDDIPDRSALDVIVGIARYRSEVLVRHLLHISVCAKEFLIAAAHPVNDLAEPAGAFRIITINTAYEAAVALLIDYGNPDAADALAVGGNFGVLRKRIHIGQNKFRLIFS